jgi:hypothetical protein
VIHNKQNLDYARRKEMKRERNWYLHIGGKCPLIKRNSFMKSGKNYNLTNREWVMQRGRK